LVIVNSETLIWLKKYKNQKNMTQLIEFKNNDEETLRGLLDSAESPRGIIFVHGFERTTIEAKFKLLADKLKGKINLFRFDFSGCGLSDGSFFDFSVDKSAKELQKAIECFTQQINITDLIIVGHSVGACIVLQYLRNYYQKEIMVNKVLFFSPALNQKQLLRYYFVKNKNRDKEITWQNFNNYLIEEEFFKDLNQSKRMSKEHWLGQNYFTECSQIDFNDFLPLPAIKILNIHGNQDDKVPLESNKHTADIIINNGDHDLQRPDMVGQYLNTVIDFLIN